MKVLGLKKSILSVLLICVMLMSVFAFSACKKNNNPPEEEIEMADGVNVVIDVDEFDTLLAQAKTNPARKIYQLVDSEKYSKADLLLVINQIKENIENSTAIGAVTNYTYDGYKNEGVAVSTITERYNYDKQYGLDGKTVVAEYHSWTKKEGNELYYYEKAYEEGQARKTRHIAEPYLNNNGVYDFCQGIFTFTSKTLTEQDIEKFKINKNKVYIKIKTTVFHDVEEGIEVQEIFQVKKGKIVKDRLLWPGVDMNIDYTFNEDVNLSLLELPANETWN